MTVLRLRYVQAWVDANGRAHHYFRRAGFARVPLPGLPGSPEFMHAYEAAMVVPVEIGASKRSPPGSVARAIASYFASPAFTKGLAESSRVVRRTVLEAFRREHGSKQITAMQRRHIEAILEPMTPTTGRNWHKALRALLTHCINTGMVRDDPMLGLKPPRIKSDGHHTLTEDEIARFEARHPIGSRERLAFALGLYTGQRRGDVIRMGRQHIRDGLVHVVQAKTGKVLVIPIHPELARALAAVPPTQMMLLTTLRGKPFGGTMFSQWFAKAVKRAGLAKQCTFHGLRKAACRRLAEAGCTVHEIMAISGHASLKEVERYTKAADQARLAKAAMERQTKAAEQTGTNHRQNLSDATVKGVDNTDEMGFA